ncbi:hypothetical protein TbrSNM41_24660 (plasmid) [Thermus brockianus]|uniref:Uncharacterized protein n=1 Tax=Thermus brockianus TaxID=56956 RepID=A0ABN6NJD1_THEBO|nr:hypothetical protein TbrSNM41_24660 [Thermus brockianus]
MWVSAVAGHCLRHSLHLLQRRLGGHGELGQGAGLEAPVELLLEGLTGVGVPAQGHPGTDPNRRAE